PTALSFLILGLGTVFVRPTRGLMATATSRYVGGQMLRRLLPIGVLLPIGIAWPSAFGERAGLYSTEDGVTIFATILIGSFTLMVWFSARRLNAVDLERTRANETLQRTASELRETNEQLEAEIAERVLAEEASRASEERFLKAFHVNPAGMVYARVRDRCYI